LPASSFCRSFIIAAMLLSKFRTTSRPASSSALARRRRDEVEREPGRGSGRHGTYERRSTRKGHPAFVGPLPSRPMRTSEIPMLAGRCAATVLSPRST
jgi:hypothetical protein